MAGKMLVATRTFITYVDGKRVVVTKGKTRVREGHSLTKGREGLFKDADTRFDDVEDTLARPGHKRGSQAASGGSQAAAKKAPAKKTASKKTAAKKAPAKKAAAKPAEKKS